MVLFKVLLFVVVSSLGYANCAFVDTLGKCGLKDKECQRELIQKVLKDIAKTGVPELNIPPIDPIEIKDLNLSIDNVIDIVFVEGVVKGVKNCAIDGINVNMDKSHASIELTCDITAKGKYTVKSASEGLRTLLGGDVHGEGNGKVKIEKISLKIDFPFTIVKRGDDTFFSSDVKKYKYSFNIHDKVLFAADNLFLGDKESSKDIVKLLNENWRIVVESFGGHFMDVAVKYMYPFLQAFFNNVPSKSYLIDDISSYAQ